MIAPPYTSDFVQLFLPILENDSIAGTIRTEGEHDAVAEFIGTFQAVLSNKRWCSSFSTESQKPDPRLHHGGHPHSFHCSSSASADAKKVFDFHIRGRIRACKIVPSAILQDFIFVLRPKRIYFFWLQYLEWPMGENRHVAVLPVQHPVLHRCRTLAVNLAS